MELIKERISPKNQVCRKRSEKGELNKEVFAQEYTRLNVEVDSKIVYPS